MAGQPEEYPLQCVSCGGEGKKEVCLICGEEPRIIQGAEWCSCMRLVA